MNEDIEPKGNHFASLDSKNVASLMISKTDALNKFSGLEEVGRESERASVNAAGGEDLVRDGKRLESSRTDLMTEVVIRDTSTIQGGVSRINTGIANN